MGAAFGLLSLLITVAIILWAMVGTGYLGTVSKQNTVMRQQVNVMSGKDPTGTMMATDSIHTRIDRTGARPKLFISEVMTGGPMEERYGVKPGDRVIEIGGLDFEQNIGDRASAEEQLHRAYAANQPIVVQRGTERISLPTPAHEKAIVERDRKAQIDAAQANVTANTPVAPPPPKEEDVTSLQKALDKIRSTPGQ